MMHLRVHLFAAIATGAILCLPIFATETIHSDSASEEATRPSLSQSQCQEGDAFTKDSIKRGLECHRYFLQNVTSELKERERVHKSFGTTTDLENERLSTEVLRDLLNKNGFSSQEAEEIIKNLQTFEANFSRIQQDDPKKAEKEKEAQDAIENVYKKIGGELEKNSASDISKEILATLKDARLGFIQMKKPNIEKADGSTATAKKEFSIVDPSTWNLTPPLKVDSKTPDAAKKQAAINTVASGANALIGGGIVGKLATGLLTGQISNPLPSAVKEKGNESLAMSSTSSASRVKEIPKAETNSIDHTEKSSTKSPEPTNTVNKETTTQQATTKSTTPPTTSSNGSTPRGESQLPTSQEQKNKTLDINTGKTPPRSHASTHSKTTESDSVIDSSKESSTQEVQETVSSSNNTSRKTQAGRKIENTKPSPLEQMIVSQSNTYSTSDFFGSPTSSKADNPQENIVSKVKGVDKAVDYTQIDRSVTNSTSRRIQNQKNLGDNVPSFRKGTAGSSTALYAEDLKAPLEYNAEPYKTTFAPTYPTPKASTLEYLSQPIELGVLAEQEGDSGSKIERDLASVPVTTFMDTLIGFKVKPEKLYDNPSQEESNEPKTELGSMPNIPALLLPNSSEDSTSALSITEQMDAAFKAAKKVPQPITKQSKMTPVLKTQAMAAKAASSDHLADTPSSISNTLRKLIHYLFGA